MQKINNVLNKLTYPGRGIIIGLTPSKTHIVVAYFIMGRSENSKNRIFTFQKGGLKTQPIGKNIKNAELLIYNPVAKFRQFVVVSNGNQTQTIVDGLKSNKSFEQSLQSRNFENDPPIFTPRISAIVDLSNPTKPTYKMAIIKSCNGNSKCTLQFFFEYYNTPGGQGHFIHTYFNKNGNETASFEGEPLLIEIKKHQTNFHKKIWESLNNNNKVSLYTEYINIKTKECYRKITNKQQLHF